MEEESKPKSENKKMSKKIYGVTCLCSVSIFALMTTALFSPYWTECVAVRNITDAPEEVYDAPNTKYTGLIQFGVIYGYKAFNYGIGVRDRETFIVFDEYADTFNTALVTVVLVFMIPAVVFAGVAIVFGYINARRVPIETIHGRPGLYVWNAIGLCSSTIAISVYSALYAQELRYESVASEDRAHPNSFYTYSTALGYSFWLLVAGAVMYGVNLLLILATQFSHKRICRRRRTADVGDEAPPVELGKVIMY